MNGGAASLSREFVAEDWDCRSPPGGTEDGGEEDCDPVVTISPGGVPPGGVEDRAPGGGGPTPPAAVCSEGGPRGEDCDPSLLVVGALLEFSGGERESTVI